MSRKLAGLLLGLGISALAFWWAMPKDGLRSLPGFVASARLDLLTAAVAVATATFVVRALRWRLLLRTEDGTPPSLGATWHATAIGFMANNILPFRLGEVMRALALSRLSDTRFSAALATIAVERVFDALTVVGLFAAAILLGTSIPPDVTIGPVGASHLVRVIGVVGIAALAAAAVAAALPALAERWVRRLVPWAALADRLAQAIHGVAHGLRVLHDPRRILVVVGGSILLWTLNAWSFGLAFQAFGLPGGLGVAIVIQTFVVFFVAVPAAPGYAGVFELGIVAAAKLFGVPDDAALAAALTYHVLTYIPITLLGAWSLTRTGLKLGELRAAPAPERPRPGEGARPSAP